MSGVALAVLCRPTRRTGTLLPIIGVCLGACGAEQSWQSPLFDAADTRLTHEEMRAVDAAFSGSFRLSSNRLHFEDDNCGEIPTRTEVVDLNGDGTHEVFVYWGNACTSGGAGNSLSMFNRDGSGGYRDQFGFPAASYIALPVSNNGYPDLQFGGPGFCFAVWTWTGNRYEFKCNSPQEEGGCQFTGNVCPLN